MFLNPVRQPSVHLLAVQTSPIYYGIQKTATHLSVIVLFKHKRIFGSTVNY